MAIQPRNSSRQVSGRLCAEGIAERFRIGFNHSHQTRRVAFANLASALANPEVVDSYIRKEIQQGRILEPVPQELAQTFYTSPFGVIPKGHASGK